MTNINKQIEEALKNKVKNCKNSTTIFDTKNYVLFDDAVDIMTSILSQYLSDTSLADTVRNLIHSSRWRKVSEGLPEYGSIIVAKGDTSDFQDMYLIEIDSDYSMSVLTSYYKEWKPID